jgi:hypothetical protein
MSNIYSISDHFKRVDVPANHQKNNLANGTILKLHGYSDPEFVIVKRLSVDEKWGHGATYEVVNLHTFEISRKDMLGVDHIKDKEQHKGIHLFYTDEILPADWVLDIYEYAKRVKIFTDKAKTEAAQVRADNKAALPKTYPHLETQANTKRSVHALAAKNIRTELQRAFPGVKFTVRSETYAGGNAVDISWNDGPLTKDVDAIGGKYQKGHFNGMEDIYEYDRENIWGDVFGSVKYVQSQRHTSANAIRQVAEKMGYSVEFDKWDCISNLDEDTRQMVMREVWATDFYQKPTKAEPKADTPKEKPSGVVVGEYKGHPTITLPCNGKGFTFGLSKAKSILEHIEDIQKFAS